MPLGGMPLGGMPLGGMPLGGMPLGGMPLGGMPFGGMPFGGMPFGLGSAPIHALGVPPAPIPGIAPIGVPTAPIPGVAPLGVGQTPTSPATGFLLSQIALKDAVSRVGDEAVKARVIAGANEVLTRTIDDLAGVTLHPWLRSAALAWSYPVATELALLAYKYREGVVREELLNVAGQLLAKGLTYSGEDLAGVGRHHNK
jgi:5'-3' exoribonuclease 2